MQNDAVNGRNVASLSAAAAETSPDSCVPPLTDVAVLTKISAVQSDVSTQQFKSPRLQQLLGNRTTTGGSPTTSPTTTIVPAEIEAGSLSSSVAGSDNVVPAESEAGSLNAGGSVKSTGSMVPAESEVG